MDGSRAELRSRERIVITSTGDEIGYDRLLLASGRRACRTSRR
jgi:NAD(P)H-nitrite reductase large subunit